MRRNPRAPIGFIALALMTAACGAAPLEPAARAPVAVAAIVAPAVVADEAAKTSDQPGPRNGAWIGAAAETEYLLPGAGETSLGVWVDVPAMVRAARAPADVALVVDTSGSMAGPKIESARAAATELVEKLSDGDIVSVTAFSDEARVLVPPVALDGRTRAAVLHAIAGLRPWGGTNMAAGLELAEISAGGAPATHPVRRVVMISDGIANIGPSSPEVLGAMAARGAAASVQVTAIGVGLDYDEHTLDALAERSSGRLYHLDDPREMSGILEREVRLMKSTAATAAVVEIVPAPGVVVVGAEGVRVERSGNTVRVPLGAMFGGQHREMLLRVRVTADAPAGDTPRALASVRLRFNDPSEGGLERVQEVVARYQVTSDAARVEASVNGRTRAIAATLQAGAITVAAAQHVNDGRFEDADKQLAEAEAKLQRAALTARDEGDKKRVLATASALGKARATVRATAASPAPAKRARALEINATGMHTVGF